MKKITRATFKSFINKNRDQLQLKMKSRFNSSTDGVQLLKDGFDPILAADNTFDHNYGIRGVWLVGTVGGNYFTPFKADGFEGIEVYNCCASFILAVKVN